MSEVNLGKINLEVADLLALLRAHVIPGLAKAGVPSQDQQWAMTLNLQGEVFAAFVTLRVPLLLAVEVFGRGKVSEALRSRMIRAADQPEIRQMGWVKGRSQYEQWMNPEDKTHWDTLTVTFKKGRCRI